MRSFIRTRIAYATSEDAVLLERQTLENAIKEIQEKANEAEDMCIKTEGNKQPYLEQIKKYYASITELRERIKLIKQQIENNDTFQSELKQIDAWLESEEISFAEYDDTIVRYLIDSISVTDDQKLLIRLKGGSIITEELYPKAA